MSTWVLDDGTARRIEDLRPDEAADMIARLRSRAVLVLKLELDRATVHPDGADVLHGLAGDMATLWGRAVLDEQLALDWLHEHLAAELDLLAARAAS